MARRSRAGESGSIAHPGEAGSGMTLDRLLATERELTELVDRARQEAARILDSVQAQLRDLETQASTNLHEALRVLEATTLADVDHELAAVAATTEAIVARYTRVPDELTHRIADDVLDGFLGTGAPTGADRP